MERKKQRAFSLLAKYKRKRNICFVNLNYCVIMVLYRCGLEPEYEEEGLKFVQGAVEKFWQEHQKTKK